MRKGLQFAVAGSLIGAIAGSCVGGTPPVGAPPGPIDVPYIVTETHVPDEVDSSDFLVPPELVGLDDELLGSPMLRHSEFRAEVDRWVDFWETRATRWFPEYLERMSWFEETVDSVLAAEGLPPSLRYLPVIESGYHPGAVSHASAVGLWQFMQGTAEGFGLEVSPLLDERRHPYKSTEAAIAFLGDLHEQFGSWFLALAAYNSGPYRVQRLLRRHARLDAPSDSVYWKIRPYLPRETQDFVPKLFGAMMVAGSPGAYGYEAPERRGFAFDEVMIPDATTLDVVARAAETDDAEITRLNPEYVRGMTPPDRHVLVRIPEGRARAFRLNYAAIPRDERVSFVEHSVQSGETLTHIARAYGIPVSDLRAANPLIRPRYLRIGTRLVVPVSPSARKRSTGGS